MKYAVLKNNKSVPLADIPVLEYPSFLEENVSLLKQPTNHCVNYYGYENNDKVNLVCCIANDKEQSIYVSSSFVDKKQKLSSFTNQNLAFEKFERELNENFGLKYTDHPWLKPVRYSYTRDDQNKSIANYPFFKVDSEELHLVGVGPIHAGVIEPGHFRFICNGEQILHLEIQLGYQHRGVEELFLQRKKLLQRNILAESIAGDSVAAHSTAFVNLWESLCHYTASLELQFVRTLAIELERIAIHTGDLSAMCTDIGYQLGSSVYGRLRTPLINFFQKWCGNRLAKGLIRAGKCNYRFSDELAQQLTTLLDAYVSDFTDISTELFNLPSALARLEKTGVVTYEQASSIGTVGMAARMVGINRDIRSSHPHDLYSDIPYIPILEQQGDVYARAMLRKKEIDHSVLYIRRLLQKVPGHQESAVDLPKPKPDHFAISLVEGWRGEICHCAITDSNAELLHYKIKDPSFHNWLALALAVRNNEISDFPICNKSFDLSYCGHDL
ncbi:MAG: NADH dehydrogenase subunit [Candidatus Dadabacteria bacterium]